MALQLTINGDDKTKTVEFGSLVIDNILTRKTDKCTFSIKGFPDRSFKPVVGREVIVTDNATRIFGGIITKVKSKPLAFNLVRHIVECADFTRILDHKLVPDTFKDLNAEDIIASLITNYAPAGFTINNVDAPIKIDYVGFNYKSLANCLTALADLINYDWYVDYNKDIHFFAKETVAAPFGIADDDGSYVYKSLLIRKDNSQVRNVVIVRGGEYLANSFTTELRWDGSRATLNLPYKYSDFKATLTGEVLNTGIDYINDPNDYDALYNFNEKLLRFKENDIPSDGAIIRISGRPNLPVIVKMKNQQLIDAMVSAEGSDGIYEHLIIDKSIKSKAGARQRAMGEIEAYGATLTEAEFITETGGLAAGQKINVNSVSRNIDQDYIINKVTITQRTDTLLSYHISLITTRTFDLVDLLQRLILQETNKLEIKENEVVDLVENINEIITIDEALISSLEHNPQIESFIVDELFTAQSLDYEVEFVLGPFTPAGKKRVFILNGSLLGDFN